MHKLLTRLASRDCQTDRTRACITHNDDLVIVDDGIEAWKHKQYVRDLPGNHLVVGIACVLTVSNCEDRLPRELLPCKHKHNQNLSTQKLNSSALASNGGSSVHSPDQLLNVPICVQVNA